MFSGQGSQYVKMGRDLFDEDRVFRESLERCERIIRPWIGTSLIDAIYGETAPAAPVDTRLTHPAICALQYAMANSLQARGHRPDRLLGYSLGEFTAQIVGGSLSLERGLALLHCHAELMEAATPEGGMLAVLERPAVVEELGADIPDHWIAAHNFENHCVVSGRPEAIAELERRLEERGTTTQRLPVRRAFHSPLMDAAATAFRAHLRETDWRPSALDIISATTGGLQAGVESLWRATREPVNFLRTIASLEEEHPVGAVYLDLGPSGTLATFVKYIANTSASEAFMTVSPWGGAAARIEAFAKACRHG